MEGNDGSRISMSAVLSRFSSNSKSLLVVGGREREEKERKRREGERVILLLKYFYEISSSFSNTFPHVSVITALHTSMTLPTN